MRPAMSGGMVLVHELDLGGFSVGNKSHIALHQQNLFTLYIKKSFTLICF